VQTLNDELNEDDMTQSSQPLVTIKVETRNQNQVNGEVETPAHHPQTDPYYCSFLLATAFAGPHILKIKGKHPFSHPLPRSPPSLDPRGSVIASTTERPLHLAETLSCRRLIDLTFVAA